MAKCLSPNLYPKGYIITVTSKKGREVRYRVHNLIEKKDGYYFYSIISDSDFVDLHKEVLPAGERYVKYYKRGQQYKKRVKYWNTRAKDMSLAIPESVEFYEIQLHQATQKVV